MPFSSIGVSVTVSNPMPATGDRDSIREGALTYTHTHTHTCPHACTHTRLHVHTHAYTHLPTMHAHTHLPACMTHTCSHLYTHTSACMHAHTHACTCAHTHTHTPKSLYSVLIPLRGDPFPSQFRLGREARQGGGGSAEWLTSQS